MPDPNPNTATATPAATPDAAPAATGGAGGGAAAPPISPGPAVPAAPMSTAASTISDQPLEVTPDEQLRRASMGARIYHGVLNALGGSQDVAMTGYDAKGNPIYSTTPQGPGMQWKKIISGALTGLAAGSQVHGPGSPMRGFGAGYEAVQQRQDLQRQEQRQQAQQTFDNQQKAARTAADTSMINNQAAHFAYLLKDAQAKATKEDVDNMNALQQQLAAGGKGTGFVGHYPSKEEGIAAFRDNPKLHDEHAQGNLVFAPVIGADRSVKGVDMYWVTKPWKDTLTDKEETFSFPSLNPKEPGQKVTIPPGMYTQEQVMQLRLSHTAESFKQQLETFKAKSEANVQSAQAFKDVKEGQKTQADLDYFHEHNEWPGSAGKGGAGTIDPEDWPATIKEIGEGRGALGDLSRVLGKNPGLAEAINKQYPDFRSGAVKNFDKQYANFTSGKIGDALNAAGTSAKHLARLMQLNTPMSHIPGTPAYKAYQAQALPAAEELSAYYSRGKATVSGVKEYRDLLSGIGLGRDDAIYTTAGALADKFGEYHQQWQNALPSRSWNVPMPSVSNEALADLKVVEDHLAAKDPKYVRRVPAEQEIRSAPNAMGAGAAPPQQAPRGVATTPAVKPAPTLSQVPAGTQPGYDKKTGALLGYQDAQGWHPFQ